MLRWVLVFVLFGSITAFDEAFAQATKIRVVATTPDLKALAEVVGGERVEVESLLRGDQDPHQLEVKRSHIENLKEADLLIRIGLDHEPWLPRLLRLVNNDRILPRSPGYLDASKGIALLETETPRAGGGGHVHGFGNTHYWLDPENAFIITDNIMKALKRISPKDAPAFQANRKLFLDRLRSSLNRWLKVMEPYRGMRVVAYHNSWPYFANRFGITVSAFIEPKPGIPPSPSYLASLIRRMKEHNVKVVIMEPYVDEATARFVAERSGAKLVKLPPSVGIEEGAGDYIALFEHNIQKLVAALRR